MSSLKRRIKALEKAQAPAEREPVIFCWGEPTPKARATIGQWMQDHPGHDPAFFWVDGEKVVTP